MADAGPLAWLASKTSQYFWPCRLALSLVIAFPELVTGESFWMQELAVLFGPAEELRARTPDE